MWRLSLDMIDHFLISEKFIRIDLFNHGIFNGCNLIYLFRKGFFGKREAWDFLHGASKISPVIDEVTHANIVWLVL